MDLQGRSASSSVSTPSSSINPQPPSSASSRTPASGSGSTRGPTATQACDQCRRRKVRCDEGQPKCGNCAKGDLECEYRETQPTKKDKTALETLEIVKRIDRRTLEQENRENMILALISGQGLESRSGSAIPTQDSPANLPSSRQASTTEPLNRRISACEHHGEGRPPLYQSVTVGGMSQPYRHATAAHKMLTWPAIQELLRDTGISNRADIESLNAEGSAFIIRMCSGVPKLPLDEVLFEQPFLGMQTQATRQYGGARVIFRYLTHPPDKMDRLATAYFDSYNLLYPFMDRETFMSDTLAKVKSEGFDADIDSVIALLVFALGEVAEDSIWASPSHSQFHQQAKGGAGSSRSSVGSIQRRHPGISLFNEARKRIGFVMTECDLETVQVFSLTALYLESCSCHVDFWRMTASASSACHILVTCKSIDWNSPHGDIVRRAYWHCAILETGLHLELDLPLSDLLDVGRPVEPVAFQHASSESDDLAHEISHFRTHYSSQVALRRLCADIHDKINESMGTYIVPNRTSEGFNGPTAQTLDALALELEQWRSMLPAALQWPEDDPTVYPDAIDPRLRFQQNIDPSLLGDSSKLFSTPAQQTRLSAYPYVYDIQVALLRTRYYYAKYMVYRPYIYKALHFPKQISRKDAEAIAICLKACLKWPITMAPTSRRKRLIPYLFCWSQNMLGIILIMHLTKTNPVLWDIRETLCGGVGSQFEMDVDESVNLMVDWIADLKEICPIAKWCFSVLAPLLNIAE